MLHVFALMMLLSGALEAAIMDLNCTQLVGNNRKFAPTAVNCQNKLPDDVCLVLYTEAVKAMGADDRNERCYKLRDNVDPDLVQAAVDFCPQTCGYCCITPEFNCEDKRFPSVMCSKVTPAMCAAPAWKPVLAENCPKTCGLCTDASGDCVDKIKYCNRDPTICGQVSMQAFVKENCKRTCGFCQTVTTRSPVTGPCGTNPNCVNWVRNGFCTNDFYSLGQKRQYCGRECRLC